MDKFLEGAKNHVVDDIGNTAGTLAAWVYIARRWGLDTSPARRCGDRSDL